MPGCCHDDHCHAPKKTRTRVRRALWIALLINAAMFGVEFAADWKAGSVSLLADAIDFLGDAANFGIALAMLGMLPVWRSRAAMLKGLSMAGFGIFVLRRAIWQASQGQPPEPFTMGAISLLALLANVSVAVLLYAFREGEANMRSVWLCTRNDALGNIAVLLAAAGVFGTGQGWPDLAVAVVMGGLALSAGSSIIRQARQELLTPVSA
ncbi:cation diffusion facilitator family transporter [Viridibacterium curvum]|uniref:cation diffusion facilitator family transporter n=1 Tax=Viridibacterium curvum TaxID=1101404 RepID=UPI0031F16C77